ncbi:MAG TPA: helix-turn-helix domain-containing protein [Terriglobales bacterium]
MNALAISPDYALSFKAPTVIGCDEQNEEYINLLWQLEHKPDLTDEEKRFAELLTVLIHQYEEKHYQLRRASPIEIIQELMKANDLKQKDLAGVFGTESIVSEVLNGKRELNINHVRKLAERFAVSPELFL